MENVKKLLVLSSVLISATTFAELKPIADEELGNYSGQAAIAFDVNEIGTTSYTRMTLGMEADLQMNIDTLEAGRFTRTGETLESDLNMTNLAFGSISTDAAEVQLDGNTYAVNDIIPFELNDPYFEIAQNDADELTGFRIGFGEARGQLSGDINALSGNLQVDITDYFGDDYKSVMLDENGDADSVRSQYFGISNDDSGGATNCSTGFYCYQFSDFKTFDIGERNESTGQVDYTKDFFISFQKEATQWSSTTGNINAEMGVFFNIPTSIHIDMNTGAVSGASATANRSEYIDRNNGRF